MAILPRQGIASQMRNDAASEASWADVRHMRAARRYAEEVIVRCEYA